MNTFAATTSRIPRAALVAIVALTAAFAVLMGVRSIAFSSSDSVTASPATAVPFTPADASSKAAARKRVRPKVVLLPGLPSGVAHALRYSKVAVVSVYVGQAPSDHVWVTQARKGARAAGAGFVAINVGSDRTAIDMSSFAGPLSSPSMLVVRRPGTILTRISGPVDAAVVAQAAQNAGARR